MDDVKILHKPKKIIYGTTGVIHDKFVHKLNMKKDSTFKESTKYFTLVTLPHGSVYFNVPH